MDPLAPLIENLRQDGRLRVWSLVITVFGDLVQHRGGEISTARLGEVLGRIGVEAGALRTALSRLDKDGWVDRVRAGRVAICKLGAAGRAEFVNANAQIYAPPRTAPVTRWTLSVAEDQTIALKPSEEAPAGASCAVSGELTALTPAFRNRLLSSAHRAALISLARDIEALAGQTLEPLDAAAARVLLIHRWRRLALRHPEIVPELMPPDIDFPNPRAAVAQTYLALCPRAEAWLNGKGTDLPPMPKADASLSDRFRTTSA